MSGTKKVPERMCVMCHQMKPKSQLIRIVCSADGVAVDVTGKMNGRGVYLCRSKQCVSKALTAKAFARKYGFSPSEIQEQLEKLIEG